MSDSQKLIDTSLPTSLDYVHSDKQMLQELAARMFAVTNLGQQWREGKGWEEITQGTDEDYEGVLAEKNHWYKVIGKVLKKNPTCTTIRQVDEAWNAFESKT